MNKRIKIKWLSEYDFTVNSDGDFTKKEIETVLERFEKSEATYVNFKDGECVFYKEEEENDEEYNSRLKNEEEAKKLEFEKAKETYLRLKNNYETLKK
jgi:hypothetical protein